MASLATVATNIDAALDSLIGARCNSDRRDDLESLTSGTTKYQLRVDHLTELPRSGANLQAASVNVSVFHELASASAERTYTEGAMLTDQKSLMQASYWRSISGVYDVEEGPTLQDESSRVGNTITYSMAVTISLTG